MVKQVFSAAHGQDHSRVDKYFLKDLQPVEISPSWSRFMLKDSSLWRGPMLEQGKSVRRREWQASAGAQLLTPHPPVLLSGGGGAGRDRNEGVKFSLGNRGVGRKALF